MKRARNASSCCHKRRAAETGSGRSPSVTTWWRQRPASRSSAKMVNIVLIRVEFARYQSQHWSTSSRPSATAPLGVSGNRAARRSAGKAVSAQIASGVVPAVRALLVIVGSPTGMLQRRRLPEAWMAIALEWTTIRRLYCHHSVTIAPSPGTKQGNYRLKY